MEVIKCSVEDLKRDSNAYNIIFQKFLGREIDLYAFKDYEGLSGWMVLSSNEGMYVSSETSFEFDINEDYYVVGKEFDYFFKENGVLGFRRKDGLEGNVYITETGKNDAGYSGMVFFNQEKDDIFCQLMYMHRYFEDRGMARIWPYNVKDPDGVTIEYEVSRNRERDFGLIPQNLHVYNAFMCSNDQRLFQGVVLNEKVRSIITGKECLAIKGRTIKRYAKAVFALFGEYFDLGIIGEIFRPEEICDEIEKSGFMVSVPDEIIFVYNHYIYVLEAINVVKSKEVREEYSVRLKLV